jgi:cytochrome c oxidase assembly factor CtaG
MRIFWYGSIFFIVGVLVVFVPWCFDIYINDWRWWVIAMPLDFLITACIFWRDGKIKQEILEKMMKGNSK